jgi:carbonic anhydrase
MTHLDPLLERNRTFAETDAHVGLTPMPRLGVFLITCLDGRVDPAQVLGLELGDALVMRNAGGRVTDEVEHEVAFVGHVAETMFGDDAPPFEVAVVHHTGCGTGFLADDDFRSGLAGRIGVDASALAAQAVTDPTASVRADVERLRRSPLLPAKACVSGHVYDLDTGLVRTVMPSGSNRPGRDGAAAGGG